ncbi:transcription repressor NadR [Actinomyces faecalis]|uniref:transcription repressor NadR n=1 Tax=Actinomyces faecalis TaxID=2722820 RepID=UPI0015517522|nr:transcription repressor NadR [Actinomyces faecalis]
MEATQRRAAILTRLSQTSTPVPAAVLGEEMGVSRQIVVGDIALLRAAGHPVRATNRGYILARPSHAPRRSVTVRHSNEAAARELRTILAAGGSVLDTSIEHGLYGQITVDLLIRSQEDLEDFLARLSTTPHASPLCTLTDGWHTHTIEAANEEVLDAVEQALDELGILQR